MLQAPWNRRPTFTHGIHPDDAKAMTRDLPIRRLPFPPELIVPLSQHTGAPAKSLVREGQEVVRGEPIAEPGGFVSVPMHAPVTGIVERIGLARDVRGGMSPAIFIRAYPGASQEVLYERDVDIESMSPKELIDAVQATGVVGLGGAAFPTHVKLSVPEGKKVDHVIVNGCECEPYLTTDHRVMVEQPEDVVKGARILMRAYGAKKVYFGVEDNKLDAADALRRAIPADPAYEVVVMQTKYPQGAEKMLIKAILGREVPSGGLPVDVGAAVFNVATLAQLGQLLPKSQGLIERVVTVTGAGVDKPGNYLAALGTPLRYVLEYCKFKGEAAAGVILGGPMMGMDAGTIDIPLTKGITGILVLTRANGSLSAKIFPCIKCGACVEACPMHLNPAQLGLYARKREYDAMADHYHLMDCFECGCCSYVCPSNIPLVQYFRVAKGIVRERKAASVRR